jgi:hypothetical protein
MYNPPRPSIAQPGRRFRPKTRGVQSGAPGRASLADSPLPPDGRRLLTKRPLALAVCASLAIGGVAGYLGGLTQHSRSPQETAAASPAVPVPRAPSVYSPPLTPELQSELDAAFEVLKNNRPADAHKRFAALLKQRPDWVALNLEMARAAFYQRDFNATEAMVEAGNASGAISIADGEFLLALLRMNTKRYDIANHSFERAAAADPTRADIYFFWGDCLRRQGKPAEASEKLRAALLRNQYETETSLYQTKLWLSEIQADRETVSGSGAAIDAGLAKPHPSSAVLLAAAAREIKAGRITQAADYIALARQIMEPAVFSIIMQDPTFMQESWRTEMTVFYRQPKPPEKASSPTPSPQAKAESDKPSAP